VGMVSRSDSIPSAAAAALSIQQWPNDPMAQ